MPLLPVTCQENNGSVGEQKVLFLFIFLTGEKKANPELQCPSIYQLKREKSEYYE